MVDEHEESPEEEELGEFAEVKDVYVGDKELEEDEMEEFIKFDDGQESFEGNNEDFEGINETLNESREAITYNEGSIAQGGGEGGGAGGIETNEGGIEFRPLPGDGKLKNPFKYFKE